MTRRASTFDRRDAVQAFCAAHRHGGTVERVEHLADRFLESRHAVAVEGRPAIVGRDAIRRRDGRLVARATGARYTTPDMLACERRLVGAAARRGEGAGTADERCVARAVAARPGLGAEQRAMVRSLTRSGDGVLVVQAAAGTGKTYALDAAREVWQASLPRRRGEPVGAGAV